MTSLVLLICLSRDIGLPLCEIWGPWDLFVANVTRSFRRVNICKAAGPDGIPGCVIRACTNQLAGVFTDIFNLYLSLSVVPTCFKMATIVPVPKQSKITCLNDWCPVALTHIISKCFERLIRDYICSVLPPSLDPLQFAYHSNSSTDDAIASTIHTALSHLEKRNTYVRILFVDYSSAFNTIVPSKLYEKLRALGLNSLLCSWILDFLSSRCQVVRMGSNISSSLTLNTGAPQGCVLSSLLYSLHTHDCEATHSSSAIIKFADDTTVVGLITDNDETAYREVVHTLTCWCQEHNLSLNVSKTKEVVVDFRRKDREHSPITINGAPVERVSSFKFLSVHITEELTWSVHTEAVVKKAHQHLFFLRWLRKFGMNHHILTRFYTCTVESILTGCISAWYSNSTTHNCKALQRVVRTIRHIIGGELPSLQDIYTRRCVKKVWRVIRDSSHPSHGLLSLLPSGRRYRSIRTCTTGLHDSFFPQAIRLLNS
ncbi:sialidase-4 isoform X1 [Myxocyprinus asiaticus]|uniref:sialidase-4 isoform X1 n=1 Tax=Myxocyprinus asiaticus TaxID=70543 RepID=UPI0022231DCB|nr:sialidase-4 isoform X1 [Myxocyprinus asiaticus]XP_051521147.1 sialidase-4 isoform X1 [Myxocyprinus asiaticus]XP_051521149.1 sialidase-4 isoform X1 [Myxocyprinus asiaticus]XP_051521150.1 sialidase-4 isoform X1 [Myxocyprinus asiaticus]